VESLGGMDGINKPQLYLVYSDVFMNLNEESDKDEIEIEVKRIFANNGIDVDIHRLNEQEGRDKNVLAGNDYGVVIDKNNPNGTPGLSVPMKTPYISSYKYTGNWFPTFTLAEGSEDLATYVLFYQPANLYKNVHTDRALTVANINPFAAVDHTANNKDVAHTAAHEIAHQMLNRAIKYAGVSPFSVGLDEGLHYSTKPNLLVQGKSRYDSPNQPNYNRLLNQHLDLIKKYHAR
jgi:hypothetical protein